MLIKSAQIITPFETIPESLLWVDQAGKIAWIGEEADLPARLAGDEKLEFLHGRVLPGLIDIHVHGGFGHSFGTGDLKEGLMLYSQQVARSGVTGFTPSIAAEDPDRLVDLIETYVRLFETESFPGARPLGLHLEGPFLNPEKKGAFSTRWLRSPDLAETKRYLEAGAGWIRHVTIAPELSGALEVAAYLKSQGVVAAIGHSDCDYETAIQALRADFSHVTHGFNAMRGFNQREPGVIGAVLASDYVTVELIADKLHVHPAAMVILERCAGPDRIILVSDALGATGLGSGEYASLGQKIVIKNGLAYLESGTIAGSTLLLNLAVRNAAKAMKVSFGQALAMASRNPAHLLKLDKKRGSIKVGKYADLSILDENDEIVLTMVEGKVVYQRG